MKWLRGLFQKPAEKTPGNANLPVLRHVDLVENLFIPEPTRSLLWVTNEDVSKISSPSAITITISLDPVGVTTAVDDGKNLHGEPSLIWTRLPVKKNSELEKEPMYYPSYPGLTPEHRYQYLKWLTDVTQPTNLSYVFLYFYGLERHLLVGDFDAAASEVIRLIDCHSAGSFRGYAERSLIVAALHKHQLRIFEERPDLLDDLSNEALLIKTHLGKRLQPQELMRLASRVGMQNRRYIKLYPDKFSIELEKLLVKFEYEHGPILEMLPVEDLRIEEESVFANLSLPDKVREVNVPQLLSDERFQDACRDLLEQAHLNLKVKNGGRIRK